MNKTLRLTLILFLVCAITAGILAAVYMITAPKIAEQKELKTAKAYSLVLEAPSYTPVSYDTAAFPTVKNLSEASNGGGWVVESTFSGAQGNITMAIGVDPDMKCTGISITSHAETSGLGAVAASASEAGVNFRNQFIGTDKSLLLKKYGGEIDAITGATITSKAVAEAVSVAIQAVESVQ